MKYIHDVTAIFLEAWFFDQTRDDVSLDHIGCSNCSKSHFAGRIQIWTNISSITFVNNGYILSEWHGTACRVRSSWIRSLIGAISDHRTDVRSEQVMQSSLGNIKSNMCWYNLCDTARDVDINPTKQCTISRKDCFHQMSGMSQQRKCTERLTSKLDYPSRDQRQWNWPT